MFYENSNFIYFFGILLLGFTAVRIYFHYKFKRDPQTTEFEKSVLHFKLVSGFFAALIYLLVFYLPLTGFHTHIYLDDSQEKVLRQLVENQEQISKEVDRLREILYLVMFLIAGYISGLVTFIGKLQKNRRKDLIENDPTLQRPLGL